MKDRDLKAIVQLELSQQGYTLWKNNVGALEDTHGRLVKYGLCVGSSDLIGFKVEQIHLDRFNSSEPMARFAAIECKSFKDKLSKSQHTFLSHVLASGGIAKVAQEQKDGTVKIMDYEG